MEVDFSLCPLFHSLIMRDLKYFLFAYNDKDEKLQVFSSASLEQVVSVACALYSASELEFKILSHSGNLLVSFVKPKD